jgi:hypothetical protein
VTAYAEIIHLAELAALTGQVGSSTNLFCNPINRELALRTWRVHHALKETR